MSSGCSQPAHPSAVQTGHTLVNTDLVCWSCSHLPLPSTLPVEQATADTAQYPSVTTTVMIVVAMIIVDLNRLHMRQHWPCVQELFSTGTFRYPPNWTGPS